MDEQRNTQIQVASRKRLCLFAGYNAKGCIHDYVVFYVSRLAEIAEVHYLADCEMGVGQLEKLAPHVKTARGYRHEKYDFGSWQELIGHIGWDEIKAYDELILCNDSCYGPLFPLEAIFSMMGAKPIDFWGMTESSELSTRHLQSYFLVFGKNVIDANVLHLFFAGLCKQSEFWNYVVKYEISLTQMLVNKGFKFESFLRAESVINMTSFPRTLVHDFQFPFIKIKPFTNPETNLKEPVGGLDHLLPKDTSYDVSLIATHLASAAPDYEERIRRRFEGNPVFPLPTKPEKVLVHLHLGHPEEAPYFVDRLANISCDFDLYLTVARMDDLTKEQFKSYANRMTTLELPNADNDVLGFLHVMHRVRPGQYEYILKLHSTGIQFDHERLLGVNVYAYGWRNALVETLLESEAVFQRLLAELRADPGKGMIGSGLLLSAEMREPSREKEHLVETWSHAMKLNSKNHPAPVLAGRMFLMRTSLCLHLNAIDLAEIELDFKEGRLAGETIGPAAEKIFALLLDHGNSMISSPRIPVAMKQTQQHNLQIYDFGGDSTQAATTRPEPKNIVFVCHGGVTSQSTYHVLSIAEQLEKLGHACVACIPDSANDSDVGMRLTSIPIRTFQEIRTRGVEFTNGNGPTLIHCWTPREQVKNFTMELSSRYKCPYFVHLEDNEREILNRELRKISYEELSRLPASEQGKHIVNSEIRIHPQKHWEFLHGATGCTILIDKLVEHVPTGIPVQLFWPGYDDCFAEHLTNQREDLRGRYGVSEDSFVILYSGAFHGINEDEIYRMVIVLEILFNRGMPLTFVKTGPNGFPDLLKEGIEAGWIKDLGFLPRDELPGVLSMSDILIQPGCSDPFNDYRFPSKLPEALISGVPVILPYSNLGRILKNKEEALVSYDHSIDTLIDRITYLYDHPLERLAIGRNGQAFCREHLDWGQASQKINDFYVACLMDSSEILNKKGLIQMKVTDNLSRSSSLVSCGEIGKFSAPVELNEIYQIFMKDTKPEGGITMPPHRREPRWSDLERKYIRKKRRLKRFTLISLIELGIILVLVFIIFHSK